MGFTCEVCLKIFHRLLKSDEKFINGKLQYFPFNAKILIGLVVYADYQKYPAFRFKYHGESRI